MIRGRVVTADTGTPVRRAEVQASVGGQRSRAALTDTDGRFELRDLPAGSWAVRVSKTGFVTQQFGQRAAFTASDPVVLADGQQFAADFTLMRGGIITGRVFDELGDPVANVRITALRAQLSATGRRMVNAGGNLATSDDTGAFRLYGLAPGSYYVSALPPSNSAGLIATTDGPVTFSPTYFPGTTDGSAAQRIPIAAGQEQSNIDFALTASRAVRVSGTVLGLNGTPIQGMVNLAPAAFGDMSSGDRRVSTAADGTFALPNVTAGNYILEFTARVASQNALPEVAAVPLTVGSGDLSGLTITTSRGARVSGTIATDNGSRLEWAGIRATAPALRNTPGGFSPRVQVTSGATFELEGLIGAHTLRFDQLPAGWIVKSVTANSTDVTDVPLDFRGIEQVSVRVVLTDKVTNLTGTVTTDVSPRGASVVIFPDDKAKWTTTSRYVRAVRVADTGQFSTRGLPSGERYLVAALEYIENGEQLDPEFLERLKPIATSVSLAEGEQKQLNLALHPRK